MIGAIAGDIIGSVYEARPIKTTDFPLFSPRSRFTDDTVLTAATADCILHGGDYLDKYKEYFSYYPHAGYGGTFMHWAASPTLREPYNSWGNGSAMRVSPVGFAFDTMEKVLQEARRSAEVTHNHPEGIKGAQAVAAAVFLAKNGENKAGIKKYIEERFGYNLDGGVSEIRKTYTFDVSCQGSVPQAIVAFIESENFEDAVRKAISLGGDSDTLACMAGAISQAYYKSIPQFIVETVYESLDDRLGKITGEFTARFCRYLL